MRSGYNYTTDISEQLHSSNVKEAYCSNITFQYIWQMLKTNDECTSLDNMKEALSYLALQDWYNINSANVFNLLSTANEQQNTSRAHPLNLQRCQEESFFRPIS